MCELLMKIENVLFYLWRNIYSISIYLFIYFSVRLKFDNWFHRCSYIGTIHTRLKDKYTFTYLVNLLWLLRNILFFSLLSYSISHFSLGKILNYLKNLISLLEYVHLLTSLSNYNPYNRMQYLSITLENRKNNHKPSSLYHSSIIASKETNVC